MDNQHKGRDKGHKKRKSGQKARFLAKARKFGKQGKLGHGFEVDSETYNYFVRVLDLWRQNEFESKEDSDVFLLNSLSQTVDLEVSLSSNQMISRVLECLLPAAPDEIIERFARAFTPNLRTICADPFASHVMEKLLEVACSRTTNEQLTAWFRNSSQFVLNNFEEFIFGNFANHVMRKVCQCLSGSLETNKKGVVVQAENKNLQVVPTMVKPSVTLREKDCEILVSFAQQFLDWPQFFDLLSVELTSGFVQCLMTALKPVDVTLLSKIIARVITCVGTELNVENKPQMHTVEVCLSLADETTFGIMLDRFYSNKLGNLAKHDKGNFSVRKLLSCAPSKAMFDRVFEELIPHMQDVFSAGYASVFTAMAQGCVQHKSNQAQFVKLICKVFGYEDDENKENIVLHLSRFGKTFQSNETEGVPEYKTDINGAMILQYMLQFHKPTMIVGNLLKLDGSEISKLAMDAKGSHVMVCFYKTDAIGDKTKENLLNKLQDHLVSLACNKFGSRVVDAIWDWGSMKHKEVVVASLCHRESQLNANAFGKFISSNFGLHLYKKSQAQWGQTISSSAKRKEDVQKFLAEVKEIEKNIKRKAKAESESWDDEVKHKSKKKRKDKSNTDCSSSDMNDSVVPEETIEEVKPEKKKKRKRDRDRDLEDAEELEDTKPNEATEEVTEVAEKKKKKKKKKNKDHDDD